MEFIKQLLTMIALNADKLTLPSTVRLLKKLQGTQKEFVNQVSIILENSLIPQIDKLKE